MVLNMLSAVVTQNVSGNCGGTIRNRFRPNGRGLLPFAFLPGAGGTHSSPAGGWQATVWEPKP